MVITLSKIYKQYPRLIPSSFVILYDLNNYFCGTLYNRPSIIDIFTLNNIYKIF